MVMLLAFLIRQAAQNTTLIRNSKNALYQFLASRLAIRSILADFCKDFIAYSRWLAFLRSGAGSL